MEPDMKDLISEITAMTDAMVNHMEDSVSDKKRGQKAAALRARKTSLELEKRLLDYRKRSIKEIG